MRLFLVRAIAEPVEAGGGGAEIDDQQEEGRQRIDAEMRADPGQAERQGQGRGIAAAEQGGERGERGDERDGQGGAVDGARRERMAAEADGDDRRGEEQAQRRS